MQFDGTILAIDPAGITGVCEGRPGKVPRLSSLKFKADISDEPEVIFGRAVHWLADRLRTDPPSLIAIEQPFPSNNFASTMITIGLYGVLTGIVRCKAIPLKLAPVQTWRKYFLGKGNLKGDEAKRQCVKLCAQLGWDVPIVGRSPDHNAAEAAGIFSWASSQVDPRNVTRVEPLFAVAP